MDGVILNVWNNCCSFSAKWFLKECTPTSPTSLFFFPFLGYKRNWNCKSLSKISKDITTLLLKYNTETFCQLNFSGCALQEVDIVSPLHFACYMVWYKTLQVDKQEARRTPTQSVAGRGYIHFQYVCGQQTHFRTFPHHLLQLHFC